MARRWSGHRGLVARQLGVVGVLACSLLPARGRAEDQSVAIRCPQLDREGAAEIESLARAALLTSTLRGSIAIDCEAESVVVTATAAGDSKSVRATPASATFRDEVLAAVDAVLEQLRPTPASRPTVQGGEVVPAEPPVTEPPVTPAPVTAATPEAAAPVTSPPRQARTAPSRPAPLHKELYAAAGLEAWSTGLAGTAWVGARGGGRYARLGLRGGVARQVAQDDSFNASELAVAIEALLAPDFAGLRFAVYAGPSLLIVSPKAGVTALGDSSAAALLLGAELSRPVWLGRFAVVPALGVRSFGSARGVRLDGRERLVLGGFQPSVSLALSYDLK